jgi:hypothetical protein
VFLARLYPEQESCSLNCFGCADKHVPGKVRVLILTLLGKKTTDNPNMGKEVCTVIDLMVLSFIVGV